MQFLQLPYEIRLNIYSQLFGEGIALVDGGRQDSGNEAEFPSFLPSMTCAEFSQERSGQMLRTCKAILAEARPILYQHTTFRSTFQAYAGKLPTRMTNGNSIFPYVRHLQWQLRCDMLKRYNPAAVEISACDVGGLQSLLLVCQTETWNSSFCGTGTDRDVYVGGREHFLDFAKLLQSKMNSSPKPVTLLENFAHLSRGRIMLRLVRGKYVLQAEVSMPVIMN